VMFASAWPGAHGRRTIEAKPSLINRALLPLVRPVPPTR
jgi:hypothetical protein